MHSVMLGLNDETPTGEQSRKLLLNNSNTGLELEGVRRFYEHIFQSYSQHAKLSALFIPNSDLGKLLVKDLFSCSVEEFYERGNQATANYNANASAVANSNVAESSLPEPSLGIRPNI